MLTSQRLKQLVHYEPRSGEFTWLVAKSNRNAGSVAGRKLHQRGYRAIGIDRREYLSHRLAWLYMTGEWPSDVIDHIDGNPSNNEWSNLRSVSKSINQENRKRAASNSSTGLLGVVADKAKNLYAARIQVKGRKIHLGSFASPEPAHLLYLIAKRELHEGNTL